MQRIRIHWHSSRTTIRSFSHCPARSAGGALLSCPPHRSFRVLRPRCRQQKLLPASIPFFALFGFFRGYLTPTSFLFRRSGQFLLDIWRYSGMGALVNQKTNHRVIERKAPRRASPPRYRRRNSRPLRNRSWRTSPLARCPQKFHEWSDLPGFTWIYLDLPGFAWIWPDPHFPPDTTPHPQTQTARRRSSRVLTHSPIHLVTHSSPIRH